MSDGIDLADPDFEPTDEQLAQLSKEAFAGIREAHEQALERLRAAIERERQRVLSRLDKP